MGQLGFYLDSQACIGCKACQMACKDKNDLEVGELFRVVYDVEGGSWESDGASSWVADGVFGYHISRGCNHCADPACVQVCPVGAMQKDPDTGIVWTDHDTCIGCRMCESACPYGAPRFLEAKGYMGKCDMCRDEIHAGRDPYCVRVCALRALRYGDLDELRATYGEGDVEVAPLPPDTTGASFVVNPHEHAPKTDGGSWTLTSFDFEV